MKRIVCLILGLCLILSLLGGCGQSASSAPQESSSVSAEETVSAEAPEEPAAQPEETPAPEVEPSAVEAEVEAEPIEVTYPLTEETVELHMWAEAPSLGPLSMMGGDYGIDTFEDFASVQYVNELTNVHMTFDAANFANASELFNLHVASGDYADLLSSVDSYYTGGVAAAYAEDVIIGLSEYLPEYAPHYYATIQSDNDLLHATTASDGTVLQVNGLFGKTYIAQGTVIRKDWLDRVNMDTPTTIDELHDVLLAFQTEIGCANPIYVNSACNQLLTSYDLVYYSDLGGSDMAMFQIDGTVHCTFTDDQYRDWLTMMHQWYTEGLIDPDFVSVASTVFGGHDEELLAQDDLGVWWGSVNAFTNYASMCPDENFDLVSCYIAGTEDGVDHTTSLSRLFVFSNHVTGVAVSSNCRDIPCALGWLDYWYSDEGIQLANYGIEGEVYNMVNGEVQYTELITENEYGVDPTVVLNLYQVAGAPFGVQCDERTFPFYIQQQVDALEVWTNACDGAYTYPNASMNEEETELLTAHVGDVMTHIATCVPQFIIGERDIETEWDAYLAEVETMGFQDCVDAYQSALDRYYAS